MFSLSTLNNKIAFFTILWFITIEVSYCFFIAFRFILIVRVLSLPFHNIIGVPFRRETDGTLFLGLCCQFVYPSICLSVISLYKCHEPDSWHFHRITKNSKKLKGTPTQVSTFFVYFIIRKTLVCEYDSHFTEFFVFATFSVEKCRYSNLQRYMLFFNM